MNSNIVSICADMLMLADGRRKLLDINLRDVELASDVDLPAIAESLNGYSGSDITNVCRSDAVFTLERIVICRPNGPHYEFCPSLCLTVSVCLPL